VNVHYSPGAAVSSSLLGIPFTNLNLTGGTPPTGPFALAGATLTMSFTNFGVDNSGRTQNTGATGTDAAILNTIANEMFYIGATNHTLATMTFSGLSPLTDLYVQVLGGDDGWFGDLAVLANGASVGTWMGVADSNRNTGALLGFYAQSDLSGVLQLDFSVASGNFAGISGLILTIQTPEPATMTLLAAGLGALAVRRRTRRK
jgi:hypothetical protein